jgi:Domain of unknown function (DUF6429)
VDIDTDKIDAAVLALLFLTLHDGVHAWKGHDWDALDRLYRKGMIDNPVGKAKSVVLTDEGLSERALVQEAVREIGGMIATLTPPPPMGAKFQGKSSSSRLSG